MSKSPFQYGRLLSMGFDVLISAQIVFSGFDCGIVADSYTRFTSIHLLLKRSKCSVYHTLLMQGFPKCPRQKLQYYLGVEGVHFLHYRS